MYAGIKKLSTAMGIRDIEWLSIPIAVSVMCDPNAKISSEPRTMATSVCSRSLDTDGDSLRVLVSATVIR